MSQVHQQSCTNKAVYKFPTEYAEHTEPSSREVPPTDRHRCALIRRVWHPAIPTPPITQPNHLRKSVKSVGEYYHVPNKADGERVPTEYAEHTEHSGRESLPQIGTDAHRLGGYGIPAIPTHPSFPTLAPLFLPLHALLFPRSPHLFSSSYSLLLSSALTDADARIDRRRCSYRPTRMTFVDVSQCQTFTFV